MNSVTTNGRPAAARGARRAAAIMSLLTDSPGESVMKLMIGACLVGSVVIH
ncbi:hypothetical protein JQS43_19130 [Natronosporangium hydrolyticum]|uniref:Uncharacterized protein n=1 Tax=Natronosporangium hydrolyticum TaxID=2811111 RepID=A0A895YHP1_9ACTN|nr:hypothetical protein [Natronosporangium hydrolyticum]QSB13670.1 hypothetical protein JQS43_19130 [Natronosporangium hydrolyticum]